MSGFCVIEGPDGVGKTYLARRLRHYIQTCGERYCVVVLKDDPCDDDASDSARRLSRLHDLIWPAETSERLWEYPHDYWLHMLCAWFVLFYDKRVAPEIRDNRIVVTDGWYFKYLAMLAAARPDGPGISDAKVACATLPQPDLVIAIRCPPGDVLKRKHEVKPIECGALVSPTFIPDRPESRFVEYQTRCGEALDSLLTGHARGRWVPRDDLSPAMLLSMIHDYFQPGASP